VFADQQRLIPSPRLVRLPSRLWHLADCLAADQADMHSDELVSGLILVLNTGSSALLIAVAAAAESRSRAIEPRDSKRR
jgi:hypothetical protein